MKNPQNCRENGVSCHSLKANNRHKKSKGKSTKKQKETTQQARQQKQKNQEAPNARKLGLEGDAMEMASKESNKTEKR